MTYCAARICCVRPNRWGAPRGGGETLAHQPVYIKTHIRTSYVYTASYYRAGLPNSTDQPIVHNVKSGSRSLLMAKMARNMAQLPVNSVIVASQAGPG